MGHVSELRQGQDKVRVSRRQSDVAFEALHRAIVRCEIAPGSVITEAELSAQFGVGRAAARAAVDRLSLLGLLQPVHRQGYRIKPITLRDLNDLFQLREIVETACVKLAVGRVDGVDLGRLDRLCRADYQPGDRESEAVFLQRNSEFHLSVAAATGNDRLVSVLGQTLAELERMFHFGLCLRNRGNEMHSEHQALIDALSAGDIATAEAVTVSQIRASRAMILDAMLSSTSLLDATIGTDGPRR
ncbi:MAG TPA: GntR family transcriptional regulator [Acidiphilium sp.]